MNTFISGVIGGFIGIVITALFTFRKERIILIERWINALRNEISLYLGKCEHARALQHLNNNTIFNDIFSELMSSMYKIVLLLDATKPEQKSLIDQVKSLKTVALTGNSDDFEECKNEIVKHSSSITKDHWDKLNSELKKGLLLSAIQNKICK